MTTTIQLQSGAKEADIVTALSKLSTGGTLVLPKGETILIGSGLKIDVSSRSIALDLNGSTLKQAGNTAVIAANGATGPVQSVKIGFTADGKTTLTYPTTPQGAAAGDWIKVFSDDRLPYDHVDGGHPTRLGQAMKVVSVSGNTVVLEGKPVYGELYKTNVRAAEIRSGELSILNGTVQGNQAQTTWKSDLVHVRNTVGAQIERLTVKDGNSIGINIVNSVNAEVTDSVVRNLKDDTANGNFGYGVHSVSSVGTTVTGLYAEKVRHATDNYGNNTVAGTSDVTRYGADIGFVVRDSVAYATTNNAWGWHSEGVNGVLDRVMSFDSHGSIGARGVGHRVTDASSVNDQRGVLLYEYGDGDARNMTFDRMLTKETGLFAYTAVGAPTGNTISNSAFEVYGSTGSPGTTRLVNNMVVKADANENDVTTGGAGADRLLGGKGLDTLQGAGGDDLIWGGAAADALSGGAGRDRFAYHQASEAGDVILDFQAGAGGDVIDLSVMAARHGWTGDLAARGYLRFLQQGADTLLQADADGGGNGYVTLATLKNVQASGITAANLQTLLSGGGGSYVPPPTPPATSPTPVPAPVEPAPTTPVPAPTVPAPAPAEPAPVPSGATKTGTAGNDRLVGTVGRDKIAGLVGNDRLEGLGGDDVLIGGAGADTLVGGDGADAASYETAAAGVVADLAAPSLNAGDARGDVYYGIANLTGSAFADALRGNGGMNVLDGGAGNDRLQGLDGMDTLSGGAGDDRLEGGANHDLLIGGLGADTLVGGADRDTFHFATRLEGGDVIVDFQRGLDKIRLGADFGFAGTAAIKLVASGAALGDGPTLVYQQGTGVLSYDADGRGSGIAVRIADLTDGLALSVSDFLI